MTYENNRDPRLDEARSSVIAAIGVAGMTVLGALMFYSFSSGQPLIDTHPTTTFPRPATAGGSAGSTN